MKKKNLIALLCATAMILQAAPAVSASDLSSVDANAVVSAISGTAGQETNWSYENRVLRINGTGAVEATSDFDAIRSTCTRLILSDTVTSIGASAFSDFTSLESVTIPASCTAIYADAFAGCSNLKEVTFLGYGNTFEDTAFADCSADLTFYAYACSSAQYAAVRNEIPCVLLDEETSGVWGDITWELTDDGTLTLRGTGTMPSIDYTSIPSIYTPEFDQDGTFTYYPWTKYRAATKKIVIEDGVENLPIGAFAYFYQLESVTFPTTPISVDSYAFYAIGHDIAVGNVKLQKFTIPENVTLSGRDIFADSNYAEITLCADRYSQAFYYAKLYGYSFEETGIADGIVTSGTCGETATWEFDFNSGTLYINGTGATEPIPASDMKAFSSLINKIVFGEGITEINRVSSASMNVRTLVIPDGVTTIGASAFSTCSGLTSVTIPASVTSIGKRAFRTTDDEVLTIYGYAGTEAERYATENAIPFSSLSDDATTIVGDVNGDAVVNLTDAITMNKYLVGSAELTEQQLKNANCDTTDGTATVDDSDVSALMRYLVQLEDDLPVTNG